MNLDMSLREFFELSERMAAAARVIRESQAALGAPVAPPLPPTTMLHIPEAQFDALAAKHNGTAPVVQWSPEEQAIRARLRAEREAASKKLEEVVLESRQ